MNYEKLQKAIELKDEILNLEKMSKSCLNQKCEFIYFSFGNGSNREVVAYHEDIIQKVKELILLESELKLDRLRMEFNNL